ncbi:MAG: glucosamine inositolphosphorylceramide transferase family protein, partial [Candidatus Angelobacter sp.]
METIDPKAVGQRSKDASRPWTWSIAMYAGESPLRLATAPGVSNPVISAGDVTDVPARFVADPFMVTVDGLWHMFFEVLNNQSNKGDIG